MIETATIASDTVGVDTACGWQATLNLEFARRNGTTVLTRRSHTGPLRVQRPFYPESDHICHVYVIHPPGGIVNGDGLNINASMEPGAWCLLTTPGATKVYRGDSDFSTQSTRIRLKGDSVMEWLPQETILFDGARSVSTLRVDIDTHSKFLGWDITCLGRPAGGYLLHSCNIRNRFQIFKQNKPMLIEHSHYTTHHPALKANWGLRGCPVSGLLACTASDESLVSKVREITEANYDSLFAVTSLPGVLVCRYLGHRVEEARSLFVKAWDALRPAVLNENPVKPRIWNT